jgi:hypothetical protein
VPEHGLVVVGALPVGASRHWVVLLDGAMVVGYLYDPATARDTFTSGVDALLSACDVSR